MVRALAKVKTPEKEYITIVLKEEVKKLDVAQFGTWRFKGLCADLHTLDGDLRQRAL